MTRKDFERIAAAVRNARRQFSGDPDANLVVDAVALELAAFIKKDHPRFDMARFGTACENGPLNADTSGSIWNHYPECPTRRGAPHYCTCAKIRANKPEPRRESFPADKVGR